MNRKMERLYALAQAGLLFDIGKLYLKDEHSLKNDEHLRLGKPENYLNLASYRDDIERHKHVAWSLAFCDRFSDSFPISNLQTQLSHPDETILALIANHSVPKFSFQRLLQIADLCSSGIEEDDNEENDANEDVPLRSIWSEFSDQNDAACKITPLRADGWSAFPTKYAETSEHQNEYQELCNALEREMKMLTRRFQTSATLRLSALDDVLYRHSWCVPYNQEDSVSGVSLYAHSRIVAAIAVALGAEVMDEDGSIVKDIEAKDDGYFRFLVIDLSGIQNFIYDMEKSGFKGMAKVLRGRSFYVSAILEAVEIALLDQLGLPRVMTIADGGGKLTLLLPASCFDECRDYSHRLTKSLLRETHGRLNIHFGMGEPFGWGVFSDHFGDYATIKQYYDSALDDLEREKHQPLKAFLDNPCIESDKFDYGACCACGKMAGDLNYPVPGKSDYYCRNCYQQREVGEQLVKAIGYSFSVSQETDGITLPVPHKKGNISLQIHKQWDNRRLNDNCHAVYSLETSNSSLGYPLRHLANYVPCDHQGSIRNFDDIAVKSTGVSHLAAVAGDVDNLGNLFNVFWKQSRGCLAKLLTASRMLNHFFAGEMENNMQGSNIYTVYAGGDDYFYIGPWNEILDSVGGWRESFRKFVGNDNITSCSGIFVCHHHTPIQRMREVAEEQLDIAKGKKDLSRADYMQMPWDDNNALKNRIAIWGKVMSWSEDWKRVISEKDILCGLLKSGEKKSKPFNKSFYNRLLGYNRRAEVFQAGSRNLNDLMFVPHLRYDLSRNIKPDAALEDFLHFFKFTNIDENEKALFFKTIYRVPLKWTLYLNRINKEDSE